MELNNDNVSFEQTYECYLINGKLYLNYKSKEFSDILFENNEGNLIKFGYDKTENNCDNYFIEINSKIRQASLKNYPKLTITMNANLYNKNNLQFHSYPFHGKNTTILNKNGKFFENKNVYPKYFVFNKNNKYVINTQINILFELNQLTEMIKSELYAFIFHLRMEFIEKNIGELDDFIDSEDKIEYIQYQLGESLFHNGYYGPAKHSIKLYNENDDQDFDIEKEQNMNDEDDDDDDDVVDDADKTAESNDSNDFLPDIMKLNINLTNKILELENKLHNYKSEMKNENNNIKYKISSNSEKLQRHSVQLVMYFMFFIVIAIGFAI